MGCSGASRARVRAAGACDRVAHAVSLCGRLFVRRDLIHWVVEGGAGSLGRAVVRISACVSPSLFLGMRRAAAGRAWRFDVAVTEAQLVQAVKKARALGYAQNGGAPVDAHQAC